MRKLGKTSMNVKRVGFGGVPIQRITQEATIEIVDELVRQGINFIDIARGYTVSEEYLGNALEGRRDKFFIATKTMARDYYDMKSEIEISLRNLKTDCIDFIEKAIESDKFDTIQFPYNIVETQANEAFKKAHKKGIGIIMKPLAGGALDDAKLAIKYILSKEYIDVVIPGMDKIEQVAENANVLNDIVLTEEDNKNIEKIQSTLGKRFCRRCC